MRRGLKFTDAHLRRAKEFAKTKNQPVVIAEIDGEYDSREIRIVTENYADGPEFEAFDGRVLAEVWPCGATHY